MGVSRAPREVHALREFYPGSTACAQRYYSRCLRSIVDLLDVDLLDRVIEDFNVNNLGDLVQYACGKCKKVWNPPWLPPGKSKGDAEYKYFEVSVVLSSVKKLVGWKGGFQLWNKKKWLSGPLCVSNNNWQFNRIYLALSVLMKDRVPDGFNFIVPRSGKTYKKTPSVDHIEEHTIPLVACMREVLAELPTGR